MTRKKSINTFVSPSIFLHIGYARLKSLITWNVPLCLSPQQRILELVYMSLISVSFVTLSFPSYLSSAEKNAHTNWNWSLLLVISC